MPRSGIAQPFGKMAWAPSYRAPRARDFLNPPPFAPPQAPQLPPEEQALLDAMITDPDDDTPRRRIADWYAANGHENRAGFIRAQLAGEPATPDPAWASVFEHWCARDLEYRRGFVEAMSLAGRCFISIGEPLFRMTPLREVRLVAVAPYIQELIACPHLSRVEVLNLRSNRIDKRAIEMIEARGVKVL
jgi:uncharacterized protein (TIGR02996 family)